MVNRNKMKKENRNRRKKRILGKLNSFVAPMKWCGIKSFKKMDLSFIEEIKSRFFYVEL